MRISNLGRRTGSVLIALSLASSPSFASLGKVNELTTEASSESVFEATNAVVFDFKSGQAICQVSTVGHPERVPGHLIQAASSGPEEALFSRLPECGPHELAAVDYAAKNAQASSQTAALLAVNAVLALTCTIGVLAGFDSAYAYESMVVGLRHLKKKVLKDDLAVGALGGAGVTGALVGIHELLTGFEMASMLATLGSGGVGLICGGAGGLGTFMVAYFARRSANSKKIDVHGN